MIRSFRPWLAAAALTFVASAQAQTDAGTAEVLMRKSGLWEQLAGIPAQVRGGLSESLERAEPRPPELEVERLRRAAEAAYTPDKLRLATLGTVTRGLNPRHVVDLQAWFDQPIGRKISRLEEASAGDQTDTRAAMEQGVALFQQSSPDRRQLLTELAEATRAAEVITGIVINTALAARRGVVSVSPDLPGPSVDELQAALEAQRPQMLRTFAAVTLAGSARTYRSLNDDELRLYVNFQSSVAGRHFNDLCARAIDGALAEASADMGRQLASGKDSTPS